MTVIIENGLRNVFFFFFFRSFLEIRAKKKKQWEKWQAKMVRETPQK